MKASVQLGIYIHNIKTAHPNLILNLFELGETKNFFSKRIEKGVNYRRERMR